MLQAHDHVTYTHPTTSRVQTGYIHSINGDKAIVVWEPGTVEQKRPWDVVPLSELKLTD